MSSSNSLKRYLDGESWELKDTLRRQLETNEALLKPVFNISLDNQRELTLARAKCILAFPEVKECLINQPKNVKGSIKMGMAISEIYSQLDGSLAIKTGLMAWLFGGAIRSLGTDSHKKKWFESLAKIEYTGMFAMSELLHGSNVRGILTEARFDASNDEFIIHSPCEGAHKMYIGNALHGNVAIVFAQLYIEDECKGPHAFLVPIRSSDGMMSLGVSVQDLGEKGGLNGIDNGKIAFDNVRIPRMNLLNRYANVRKDGAYETSISNDSARFNAMLGALVASRVALSITATEQLKVALHIAVKYSLERRQFSVSVGSPETLIMDYQTHQLRLMPFLAIVLGLTFANRHAIDLLEDEVFHDREMVKNRSFQALAAGLKAYSTSQAVQGAQQCRECIGGAGYISENRVAGIKADADIFVTFEGDNVVMLQQVTKELLAQYSKKYDGRPMVAALSALTGSLSDFLRTSILAVNTLPVTSVAFAKRAMKFKEEKLLRMLAARLLYRINRQHEIPFDAWNECLQHVCQLGMCHIQRVTLDQFTLAVDRCPYDEDRAILGVFCRLFAMHLIYQDRAWFLENSYLTPSMSATVRDELIFLCGEARRHAAKVVNSFGHLDVIVHAPIAGVHSTTAPWFNTAAHKSKL